MDHVETHYPGTYQYPCNICSLVLNSRSKYQQHKKTHSKK
jgi:hypothetical protein